MIHQLLNLRRPLFVFDTETTGTDVRNDRIVEVGFQQWTADGLVKEWRTLVNPGVPIPASATKVHGITDAMVNGCAVCGKRRDIPTDHLRMDEEQRQIVNCHCSVFKPWPFFKQIAPNLTKGLVDCDYAGQSVRFDLRITAAEMQRVGVEWSYAGARIIDSFRLEALAVARSLGDLHEKYTGRKHDGAHGALSDARASSTVIAGQLQMYDTLPRDLDTLHERQWPGYLCDEGQFKLIDGVATCCFGKKWNGRPMRDIDAGYWDWILREDFPADVKQLAKDAKAGRFP